jgi:hypothetical protein
MTSDEPDPIMQASTDSDDDTDKANSPPPERPTLPSLPKAVPIEPRPLCPALPRQCPFDQFWIPGQSELEHQTLRTKYQLYKICGLKFMMQKVESETMAEFDRDTLGGRSLRYRLHVIQEPAKARACGSGPRCESSGVVFHDIR